MFVNEIYGPTIQGEGKSAGREVIFVRLAGCNLACFWCDTPYTWNWQGTKFAHKDKFEKAKEVHEMTVGDIFKQVKRLSKDVKAIVISGGEPMLQQTELTQLLAVLKANDYWVEIETNGTIAPTKEFFDLIDQINCSPKLPTSGVDNPEKKRIIKKALIALAASSKVNFKFVVTGIDDIFEISLLHKQFYFRDVYLMPEGRTAAEQRERMGLVQQLCQKYSFKFSPRLHVLKWDTQRKV